MNSSFHAVVIYFLMQTGKTPLHLACCGGHESLVTLLLKWYPDVHFSDKVSSLTKIKTLWFLHCFFNDLEI